MNYRNKKDFKDKTKQLLKNKQNSLKVNFWEVSDSNCIVSKTKQKGPTSSKDRTWDLLMIKMDWFGEKNAIFMVRFLKRER